MDVTGKVNSHSRARGNEEAKGFFPTFTKDISMVKSILVPCFGWDDRNVEEKSICLLDPCAGEGAFVSSIARHFEQAKGCSKAKNTCVLPYAIELDEARFERIRGTAQKVNSSFFETTTTGSFGVVLLNPPYNKSANELVDWVSKAAPLVAYHAVMVLIIPKSELKGEMIDLLRGSFSFRYAYLSEEYAKFKQVVIFLSNQRSNWDTTKRMSFYDNLDDTAENPIPSFNPDRTFKLDVNAKKSTAHPLIICDDLQDLYAECEARLENATCTYLEKLYPSNFDTSIQPATTLRTAHAVQLAAMNSQIEAVQLNGAPYLAKYMLVTDPETFQEDADGVKKETTIYKPTVETFLMNEKGVVKRAREWGFDYLDLNSQISTILLSKLSKMYVPLHQIGEDEDFFAEEMKSMGLKAPQREGVKAVIKALNQGRKGIGVRGNTGVGKTYVAKAVKRLLNSRRTIMVTEPHLVPQMVEEYKNEDFNVYVIDSWQELLELNKTRPKGLYIISYSRLRMHPNFRSTWVEKKVRTAEGIKYTAACGICNTEVGKIRKGDKKSCDCCGSPLYTYIPENTRAAMSFKKWIRDIEKDGRSTIVTSHNKQLPYIRILKKMGFDLAIFDEAHNAANLISNQGTAFIRLAAASRKVLCLTATVTNGMAKSIYNLLWGINPVQMREAGWSMSSATEFQAIFGAYKTVRKTDERNRHRESESTTTSDTAGISPAALVYTLPNFVNIDAEDFDDLPPVEREVFKCSPHPKVKECMARIESIISDAKLEKEDRMAAESVRNAAFLRVSDTFAHADDHLTLKNLHLGILKKVEVDGLLEKEERLVEVVQGAVERGERVLVLTGNTQKVDMRGPLEKIILRHVPGATVDVLSNSIPADKLVAWFGKAKGDVAIASFHRISTGLNLSQYNNLFWYDYTDNTRLAEQGEGRIRRVNTADIHRALFGEVRPVRYFYATSSEIQTAQLSYTLEKRMIAKLAEGEVPDIDPAECSSGSQSFSAMITNALKEGSFEYKDPSALLKKMTRSENAKVCAANIAPESASPAAKAKVIPFRQPEEPATVTDAGEHKVIFMVGGKEQEQTISTEQYEALDAAGLLEFTLFGTIVKDKAQRRKSA